MVGIRDLTIKFDGPNQLVIASFVHAGRQQIKKIPFSEIESIFSDRPTAAQDATSVQSNRPAEVINPPA